MGLLLTLRNSLIQPSLLDIYSGAAAAYSVRRVRSGYTGACLRVRRSSDSTEQDIGFSSGVLNTVELASFVGAGNGFVTTLYDQTGNGNHLVQATALAQPRVVISGSVVTKNGRPALDCTSSQWLGSTITGLSDATSLSNFAVISPAAAAVADGTTAHVMSIAAGGSDNLNRGLTVGSIATSVLSSEKFGVSFSNASVSAARLGSTAFASSAGQQLLFSTFALSTGTLAYSNSSSINFNLANNMTTVTNTSPSNDGSALNTFKINSIDGVNGVVAELIQESVVYLTDQTSNRAGIESAINSFYSVY
jgi:hypothetical protein